MHRLEMDYKYTRLDYCNALLAGLPSNTIKPLQMIQNAAARLVFNEPKITHVTPLFISYMAKYHFSFFGNITIHNFITILCHVGFSILQVV